MDVVDVEPVVEGAEMAAVEPKLGRVLRYVSWMVSRSRFTHKSLMSMVLACEERDFGT